MKGASILLIGMLLFTAAAMAQMEPPKRSTELNQLDYFLGTWTSEGDAKPGPMGPGGKFTTSAFGDWMAGRFYVVIHSGLKGATMGNVTSTQYMGYNSDEKVFTYDEFNNWGEHIHATGTLEGDTWKWTNEFKMGPQTMKGRYIMKIVSPVEYTFKFEVSPDGTKWETAMEGRAKKAS